MQHTKLPIKTELDDRGFLYQIYGDNLTVMPSVKRIYIVGSFSKGTIRGPHSHKTESKAYCVVSGSAKFVILDAERKVSTEVIGMRSSTLLVIPPNHPHGWVALEDGTILVGMSDRTLEESLSDDVRLDPFSVGADVWSTKPR